MSTSTGCASRSAAPGAVHPSCWFTEPWPTAGTGRTNSMPSRANLPSSPGMLPDAVGPTTSPSHSYDLDHFVDDLAGFISALGLSRPHVVGLSLGSILAIALHARHPTVARSLVLASAYAGWAELLPPTEVQRRIRLAPRDLDRPADEAARDFVGTLLPAKASQRLVDEQLAMVTQARPATTRFLLSQIAAVDLRPVLSHIDVPTLLLYGAADVRAPAAVADALRTQTDEQDRIGRPTGRLQCRRGSQQRLRRTCRPDRCGPPRSGRRRRHLPRVGDRYDYSTTHHQYRRQRTSGELPDQRHSNLGSLVAHHNSDPDRNQGRFHHDRQSIDPNGEPRPNSHLSAGPRIKRRFRGIGQDHDIRSPRGLYGHHHSHPSRRARDFHRSDHHQQSNQTWHLLGGHNRQNRSGNTCCDAVTDG